MMDEPEFPKVMMHTLMIPLGFLMERSVASIYLMAVLTVPIFSPDIEPDTSTSRKTGKVLPSVLMALAKFMNVTPFCC